MASDDGKSVPEMRGMSMTKESRERERSRQEPYSAASYSAQYGIAVEDAEEILERSDNHRRVVRQITAMFVNDSGLRRRALMLEDVVKLTEEEQKLLDRIGKVGVKEAL